MKVYLDVVFIINFLLDFNILYVVSKILKRNISLKFLLLSSLFGEVTLIFLFINITSIYLFILKILLCIFMSIIAFKYIDLRYTINNIAYIYMVSTIYGGIFYFIKSNIDNNYSYILLILCLLPLFSREIITNFKKIKTNYNYYYKIKIYFINNKNIILNSFLDTGNKLVDPYSNRGIILVDINKIKKLVNIRSPIYVPYKSLNNSGIIKCIKPLYIEINGKVFRDYLIGLSEDRFNIDGIDCVLSYKLLEDLI